MQSGGPLRRLLSRKRRRESYLWKWHPAGSASRRQGARGGRRPKVGAFISRYRGRNVNLRTQLQRIIDRAGVNRWPKLFQNLRSTCETELMQTQKANCVYAWIGNSERVANDHYLQVTDRDFDEAAGVAKAEGEPAEEIEAHFVARHRAPPSTTEHHEKQEAPRNSQFPEAFEPCKHPHGDVNTSSFSRENEVFEKPWPISWPTSQQVAWMLAQVAANPDLTAEQRGAIAQAILTHAAAGDTAPL
jgi:hypothetical protein